MIKYPNGRIYSPKESKKGKGYLSFSCANRGMGLENLINLSNKHYIEHNIALIYKRPTPINVVKVDYSKGARITDAYFEKQSTTDYNGVYKGKYIDFEAKSTHSKTSFPLNNISSHQIEHLKKVKQHGGISFFIIEFATLNTFYFLDAQFVIDFFEKEERKSIPLTYLKKYGKEIKLTLSPMLDYIKIINEKYF